MATISRASSQVVGEGLFDEDVLAPLQGVHDRLVVPTAVFVAAGRDVDDVDVRMRVEHLVHRSVGLDAVFGGHLLRLLYDGVTHGDEFGQGIFLVTLQVQFADAADADDTNFERHGSPSSGPKMYPDFSKKLYGWGSITCPTARIPGVQNDNKGTVSDMPGPETSVRFGPLRAASGRRHSHHVGLTQHVTQNVLAWMADTKLSGGPAIEIYGEKGVIIARGTDIGPAGSCPTTYGAYSCTGTRRGGLSLYSAR